MESDLKLKLHIKKDEIPVINLHSSKVYERIMKHVSSLSKEELEQAEFDLEKAILEMERRENGNN